MWTGNPKENREKERKLTGHGFGVNAASAIKAPMARLARCVARRCARSFPKSNSGWEQCVDCMRIGPIAAVVSGWREAVSIHIRDYGLTNPKSS
jgi:hypothetical protein